MSRTQISRQTRIGKGVTLNSVDSIESEEDLILEGNFNCSKVDAKNNTLVIGKDCNSSGDLYADTIVIMGNHQGNLFATSWIKVEANAILTGDLNSPKFELHPDCRFSGKLVYKD